ncbi:MAG: T9SS type A sorting domain-containing protein [Ignavibacteria bacterium]|nr:T9SS type A sorting domain-containing protein [Ignavibacteria bacterium]
MFSKYAFFLVVCLVGMFFLGFNDIKKTCRQVGLTRKNGVGCVCHNEFHSPNVNITIAGPDSVALGETANYTLTVYGGPDSAAGMNVAVLRGSLSSLDTFLVVLDSELTCTAPLRPSETGLIRWNFSYTAPFIPGADTLYAVANSVNLNGIPTEDEWNFGENVVLTAYEPNAVSEEENSLPSFRLISSYPNPFNASTNIRFLQTEPAHISLRIFDISGKVVATLLENQWMDAGTYEVPFARTFIASGLYIVYFQTPSSSLSTKIILLK